MLLSSFVGFLFFLSWFLDHQRKLTWPLISDALQGVVMIIFFSFWMLYPMLYFGYIRKSAATLEYQRLVREGEMKRLDRDARRDAAVTRDGAGPSS